MKGKQPKEHLVKQSIIQILSDGEFHSGEGIGERLGISRVAISKHIKGIQSWGLEIYRIQGKGYQLLRKIDLLDRDTIQKMTAVPVEIFPVIDSTNQYLLDCMDAKENGAVCLAEYQQQGRGRRGRQWLSPFGSNLYLSMYWQLESGIAAAMGLSLAIGIAVVDALEELGAQDIKLKWPNDIYYQDKKLAGILVEMSGQAGGTAHLVIGLGLNLAMDDKQAGIDQPWAKLEQVFSGNMPSRNDLAISIIKAWHKVLDNYELVGLGGFIERWDQLDNFKERPIKLLMGSHEIEGVGKGIDETGAIKILTSTGLETYIGGEISLRPNE